MGRIMNIYRDNDPADDNLIQQISLTENELSDDPKEGDWLVLPGGQGSYQIIRVERLWVTTYSRMCNIEFNVFIG